MPVVGAGVRVPGTEVGLGVKLAHQTPREKEADTATRITEVAERDRANDTAVRHQESALDRIVRDDGLERFR